MSNTSSKSLVPPFFYPLSLSSYATLMKFDCYLPYYFQSQASMLILLPTYHSVAKKGAIRESEVLTIVLF